VKDALQVVALKLLTDVQKCRITYDKVPTHKLENDMSIETKAFGGNGGSHSFDIEAVKSLGLRYGDLIDALLLNGRRPGGGGGVEGTIVEFHPDEYIDRITIRPGGRVIHALTISTNRGRTLSGGGNGGRREELTNIRVLGLGGVYGDFLDKLTVILDTGIVETFREPCAKVGSIEASAADLR
jgi:hypothetical protein